MTTQRIFFLGIGGTLMGSLALLARELGFDVAGNDRAIYPPMSDLLREANITVHEGFTPDQLKPAPDLVVIGNAKLPRGNEAVEYVLDHDIPHTSGAEWLGREILKGRWVIAASGTHGKTTTASMIAHILESAGLSPGFLIGGAPRNFPRSARLGETPLFVVEADEYDTSYFDRRSKFVHYHPKTLVINNIEYDHADVFASLSEIQTQFHQLIRTIPASGLIIAPAVDAGVAETLKRGCWTPVARFGDGGAMLRGIEADNGEFWHAHNASADGSRFEAWLGDRGFGTVDWDLIGEHNVENALAAIAAARHAGVHPRDAVAALNSFAGVKRRLEIIARDGSLVVYDDFAHHPTAIRATLQGLRNHVGSEHIVAVVDPGTHTMSLGALREDLAHCCAPADEAIWYRNENITWDLHEVVQASVVPATMVDSVARLADRIDDLRGETSGETRHVVLMSNGAFGGIREIVRERFREALIEPA